jgi:hypothetical protein
MGHPSMVPRGGTASARLALAWSSHVLLLWNAGHTVAAAACRTVPGPGRATSRAGGPGPADDERPADPRRSTPPALASLSRGAGGHRYGLATTAADAVIGRPASIPVVRVSLVSTRARAQDSRPVPRLDRRRSQPRVGDGERGRSSEGVRPTGRRANSRPCAVGLRMPARAAMSAGRRAPALPRPESVGRRRRRLAQPHPGRPTARSNPASATPWSPTRTSGPTC